MNNARIYKNYYVFDFGWRFAWYVRINSIKYVSYIGYTNGIIDRRLRQICNHINFYSL